MYTLYHFVIHNATIHSNFFPDALACAARAPGQQDWLEILAERLGFLGSLGSLNLTGKELRARSSLNLGSRKMADLLYCLWEFGSLTAARRAPGAQLDLSTRYPQVYCY